MVSSLNQSMLISIIKLQIYLKFHRYNYITSIYLSISKTGEYMREINHKYGKYMMSLIDGFNGYKDKTHTTINKESYSGKYLYHLSKFENLDRIKRYGLVPYELIALNTYFDTWAWEVDDFMPYYEVTKGFLSKLKGIYLGQSTKCCILETLCSEDNEDYISRNFLMFRFNKSIVEDYLYLDPENQSCISYLCVVNVPSKYIEVGIPFRKLPDSEFSFAYRWRKLKELKY